MSIAALTLCLQFVSVTSKGTDGLFGESLSFRTTTGCLFGNEEMCFEFHLEPAGEVNL